MKRILVTGGTGLLGSNLLRELLHRGYAPRVLIHNNDGSRTLADLPIERVSGDLRDLDSLQKAAQGCDAIIHVGAHTEVWPSRDPKHHLVNVQGTSKLIQVALARGVSKFIHVGSANSFVRGSKEHPGTEQHTWEHSPYGLDYILSKAAGQKQVLRAVKTQGLPGIVVNPTFMIGPFDSKPSSGAMLLALARKKVPGYSQGGKNWVYVKDVAIGICQALKQGQIGHCYILGHENLSYQEALSRMARAIEKPIPSFAIPNYLLQSMGKLGSWGGKWLGYTPPISYPMARIACEGHYYSPAKAVSELELPQTPIEVAAQEAFQWFSKNGYL